MHKNKENVGGGRPRLAAAQMFTGPCQHRVKAA